MIGLLHQGPGGASACWLMDPDVKSLILKVIAALDEICLAINDADTSSQAKLHEIESSIDGLAHSISDLRPG